MEPCSLCKGKMEHKRVDVIKKTNSKIVVINEVPAYVCQQCGERYYPLEVVESIEKILEGVAKETVKFNTIQGVELKFETVTV